MILQQCFHQQGSAYPFLQPRVKTFLTYILAAAAFGLQSHIWGYHKKSKLSWSCASPGTGARRSIYLSYFSAITSHCRLEVLSMVHLLPPQNVTLQSSAINFLLHQQELPVTRCFPWEWGSISQSCLPKPKEDSCHLKCGSWLGNLLLEFQPDLQKNLS